MAEGDGVDVVLTGDETGDDKDKKPVVEGGAKTKTVEEELAELKADRDRERTGRLDAERRATEAGGRVAQSEEEIRKSHITTMDSALEVLKGRRDQLRANYSAALATGDFDKASEYNDATIEVVQQMSEINRGKLMAETAPAPRARAAVPSGDPVVEGVASTLTPLSAAWVRAHPEYARDPRKLNEMKAAHFKVVSKMGEDKAESPEYFTAVEAELGLSGGGSVKTNGDAAGADGLNVVVSDAAKPVQERQAGTGERREVQSSPAPAQAGGTHTRTVRLTPAEQEAARISGLTNKEYAENMLAEKAKGTIGKVH